MELIETMLLGSVLHALRFYGALIVISQFRRVVGAFFLFPICLSLGIVFTASLNTESIVPLDLLFQPPKLILYALVEFISGALVGLPLFVMSESYSMSGRLVDMARGLQYGEQISPTHPLPATRLEELFGLGSLIVVFSLGLHHELIKHIWTCELPLPKLDFHKFAQLNTEVLLPKIEQIVLLLGRSLKLSVIVSSPVIFLCLSVDLGAAVFSRILGKFNLTIEAIVLKIVLALLFVYLMACYPPRSLLSIGQVARVELKGELANR